MTMSLIETVTVGSGGAANINFTNIPQTGTDLLCVLSFRGNVSGPSFYWQYNGGGGSGYSLRRLIGDGSGPGSGSQSGLGFHRLDGSAAGTGQTANTFSSIAIYIPNYSITGAKSSSVELVTENNATLSAQVLAAALCTDTAAITSLLVDTDGDLVQHSSASLYSITKA